MLSLRSSVVVCCLAAALSGCSTKSTLKVGGEKFAAATERDPVLSILTIWEPSEGKGVDGLPARGFAGQILFMTGRSNTPVAIEGDVRIYLFDDVGTVEQQAVPIHQFDFEGGAWNVHLKKTSLGPSYHVFIPYSRKDFHYNVRCGLKVRLTTKSGDLVYSDLMNVALAGPDRPESATSSLAQKSQSRAKSGSISDGILAEFNRLTAEKGGPEPEADGKINRRSFTLGRMEQSGRSTKFSTSDEQSAAAANTAIADTAESQKDAELLRLRKQLAVLQQQNASGVQHAELNVPSSQSDLQVRQVDAEVENGRLRSSETRFRNSAPSFNRSSFSDRRDTSRFESRPRKRFNLNPHPLSNAPQEQAAVEPSDQGGATHPLQARGQHPIRQSPQQQTRGQHHTPEAASPISAHPLKAFE